MHSICLDNIPVTEVHEHDHLHNFNWDLQKLVSGRLIFKVSICAFVLSSVLYMRNVMRWKCALSLTWESQSHKGSSRFFGLINYYYKFLLNLFVFLSPLYMLLKKGTFWTRSGECIQNGQEMPQSLLLLLQIDPMKELALSTDSSSWPSSIGGVLSYKMKDSSQRSIVFISCALSIAEKKYSWLQKEGLSIIFAVTKISSVSSWKTLLNSFWLQHLTVSVHWILSGTSNGLIST